MSTSWSAPDTRRTVTGTAFGRSYERSEPVGPPLRTDVIAGLLTLAVTVLAAAPVGLLWGALAPRVPIMLQGDRPLLTDVYGDGRIAADAYFLAATTLAGIVTAVVAFWLARRHGPAVVVALAAGGLAAAFLAERVGERVGLGTLRSDVTAAVQAGRDGSFQLNVMLGAKEVLAAWPVAALLTYLALVLALERASSD